MKKNRTHKRAMSEGFAAAKEKSLNTPKTQVESKAVKDDNYKPITVLWYSTESLSEDQEIGLKMLYGEDVNIDIVYDVPCHINAIKDRVKKADVIAINYTGPYMNVNKTFDRFLEVDEKKEPFDCIYTVSQESTVKTDACWLRHKYPEDDSYSRLLVSYYQINVWKDLTRDPNAEYLSAVFVPQEPLTPACILLTLPMPDSPGMRRIYRYMFIKTHMFELNDMPWSADEWLITDGEISEKMRSILEEVAATDYPSDYIVGYKYDDSYTDLENCVVTGQFIPVHIYDFEEYKHLGDHNPLRMLSEAIK